jgi:hypothetical protein
MVVGYYALSAGSVELETVPSRILKGLGRYPVPVILLTRLGVDNGEQGNGLGSALVRDALLQTVHVADRIGARALLIHAETPAAKDFYKHLLPEIQESPTDPMHLVVLMKDLRAATKAAADLIRTVHR